jgi:hypothetical protein
MPKYCPNCGKPVTDDITTICSNCGTDLSKVLRPDTDRIMPTMDRQKVFSSAIPFFTAKKYAVQTQTDYVIAFESQDRDVNWIIFVILCCFGIIPAAIYYYWFTQKHQVTVSMSGATEVKVTTIGNTEQAKKDAAEFMRTLI